MIKPAACVLDHQQKRAQCHPPVPTRPRAPAADRQRGVLLKHMRQKRVMAATAVDAARCWIEVACCAMHDMRRDGVAAVQPY